MEAYWDNIREFLKLVGVHDDRLTSEMECALFLAVADRIEERLNANLSDFLKEAGGRYVVSADLEVDVLTKGEPWCNTVVLAYHWRKGE